VCGVRITTNIAIGQHVHINLNATVGHDTSIGDFVSLNPLASISGDCVIEDDVLVGVGGIVLNGLRLGRAPLSWSGVRRTRRCSRDHGRRRTSPATRPAVEDA
jgi:acyl-[acyl carrier protein]--UDP-N-acetylglucosamine O-acyltransferase